MRHLILLFVHLVTTVLRIAQPGGLRSVIAESRSYEASAFHCESFPSVRPKPPHVGPVDCRILSALDQTDSPRALRNHIKTFNFVEFPSRSGTAKVSAAIFAAASKETWTKRSKRGFDPCGYRYETA